ncbi:MAG: DNA repair protein RecN [Desulfobacca sp.]|uniref:DNA repair protein RecN n=1 Tax=Desulfobacca sp. TaxID=2067990 RepID=UPI00404AE71A
MLTELRIKNLAILDHVELVLEPGLNVFTGETGAGKSMIVQAVQLLQGARASDDLVRTGASAAEVEARFEHLAPEVAALLAARDIAQDGELVVRRIISREGRSRSYVNDQAVTVKLLGSIVQELLHLSSQHEYQTFLAPENHLHILDDVANLTSAVQEYRANYQRWRQLQHHWQELQRRRADLDQARDFLRFQIQEIDAAQLRPDEEEDLQREQERLRHAGKLWEASRQGYDLLYGDKQAVLTRLRDVKKSLELLARFDPDWLGRLETLHNLALELEDLAFTLRDYLARVEPHPARLEEIEQRLHLMQRLKKKYGPGLQDVLAAAARARQELADLESLDDQEADLRQRLLDLERQVRGQAMALSQRRQAAASQLAVAVEAEIHSLAMPRARFFVKFLERAPDGSDERGREQLFGPHGFDRVEFFLAPNPGEDPKPLSRIASGGELSRLVLGLKTILAAGAGINTNIFDEVDAGIGGRTATVVGQKLQRLASRAQIICITHLPQIACFAQAHFRVEKRVVADRTVTIVQKLGEADRLQELARMLGGAHISDTTVAHARELLVAAQQDRQSDSHTLLSTPASTKDLRISK